MTVKSNDLNPIYNFFLFSNFFYYIQLTNFIYNPNYNNIC